jgi:EF hand domain-containing protein
MSTRPTRIREIRTTRYIVLGLAFIASLAVPGLAGAQAASPPGPRQRFDAADKNHDGRLDREEFYQLAVESFYFRDKDKKGYLTVEQLRETSPEAFKAANRKGDGRLTLEEYVNALFLDFDRADTNKDGMLSFEEIEVYRRAIGK